MDVKNAFLNDDLLEEVYKHPPLDYTHCHNQVCCHHRALYGLKQAHQFWFAKLSFVVAQQVSLLMHMTLLPSFVKPPLVSLSFFFILMTRFL